MCGKNFIISWPSSVNIWLNPEIIERIVEDDYNFECPYCKEKEFVSGKILISCPKGMFTLDLGDDYETKMEKLLEFGVIDETRKIILIKPKGELKKQQSAETTDYDDRKGSKD